MFNSHQWAYTENVEADISK